MTAQEIVSQIERLPVHEQRQVLQKLANKINPDELSEQTIAEMLLASNAISEIPSRWNQPDEDDGFEPIAVKGKSVSATILEDRE